MSICSRVITYGGGDQQVVPRTPSMSPGLSGENDHATAERRRRHATPHASLGRERRCARSATSSSRPGAPFPGSPQQGEPARRSSAPNSTDPSRPPARTALLLGVIGDGEPGGARDRVAGEGERQEQARPLVPERLHDAVVNEHAAQRRVSASRSPSDEHQVGSHAPVLDREGTASPPKPVIPRRRSAGCRTGRRSPDDPEAPGGRGQGRARGPDDRLGDERGAGSAAPPAGSPAPDRSHSAQRAGYAR